MSDTLALIIIVAFLGAVGGAVLLNVRKSRRRDAVWQHLARTYKLNYKSIAERREDKAIWRRLKGDLDGREASVTLEYSDTGGIGAVARISIIPPLRPPAGHTVPKGFEKTGDTDFDTHFVVPADAAVLAHVSRARRRELVDALEVGIGGIRADQVSVRITKGVDRIEALTSMIESVRRIADIICTERDLLTKELKDKPRRWRTGEIPLDPPPQTRAENADDGVPGSGDGWVEMAPTSPSSDSADDDAPETEPDEQDEVTDEASNDGES